MASIITSSQSNPSAQLALSSLTRATWSGFDFATISDDLRAQLQANFSASYNDFAQSALGMLLISIEAYGLDSLSFYVDRRATDLYLASARTRKSVSRLTRQLGYKMGGSTSASVDVNITVPATYGFDIPLPAGFQLQGPNNLVFQLSQPITVATGSPDATDPNVVTCYEGQTFTETFVSDGSSNQVFTLRQVPTGTYVVQGSVMVSVNGTQWTEVDLLNFEPPSTQFEVGYNDDPATIRFGDGVIATIPPSATTIVVQYIAGHGSGGQITDNVLTQPVVPLVVNFQTIPLIIQNPSGSIGGDPPETLDHAKVFAGLVWKTRQVAVTTSDYENLAGSYADPLFGRVSLAQAISVRSASQDLDLKSQIDIVNNEIDYPSAFAGQTTGTVLSPSPPATTPPTQSLVDGVYLADAKQRLAQVTNDSQAINTQLTSIATASASANTNLATLLTQTRGIRTSVMSMQSDSGNITTDVTSALTTIGAFPTSGANHLSAGTQSFLQGQINSALSDATNGINGITVGGSNQLTSVTKAFLQGALTNALSDTNNGINNISTSTGSQISTSDLSNLQALLNDASAKSSAITSSSASTVSQIGTQITTVGTVQTSLNQIGLDTVTAGSLVVTAIGFQQDIEVQVGDTSGVVESLKVIQLDPLGILGAPGSIETFNFPIQGLGLTVMSDLATIQNSIVDQTGVVTGATTEIFNHVDSILAADCQSNLITVPILATDSSGFYTPPSNGLINSLENYLEDRNEVTQTVQVVSGAASLVYAVIRVRSGYNSGFSKNVIANAESQAIDSVLKGRSFGQPLYDSELGDAVDAVDGVAFTNITIYGYLNSIADASNVSEVIQNTPLGVTPAFAPGTVSTDLSDATGNLIINSGQVVTKGVVVILPPELVT